MNTVLEARGMSAVLGGATVLDDVSFRLGAGEWLGLIGPNGAGKSTLICRVASTVRGAGQVTLRGAGPPRRRDVALVPQTPLLPDGMSVVEYVLLGRTAHLGWLARESAEDRAIVTSVLRRLALGPFASRGLGELSGGEAQRVVLARAPAQQAPVMLLDEPTSALDLGHQAQVLALVDELRRADGIGVVAAMHDLGSAARFADRLLLLDRGRVVAEGRPEEVLREDLLSAVYGTGVRVRTVDGELVVLPAPRSPAARPS